MGKEREKEKKDRVRDKLVGSIGANMIGANHLANKSHHYDLQDENKRQKDKEDSINIREESKDPLSGLGKEDGRGRSGSIAMNNMNRKMNTNLNMNSQK